MMRATLRLSVLGLAMTFIGAALPGQARADAPGPVKATASVSALALAIGQMNPYPGNIEKAGEEWCYHPETDSRPNRWNFPSPGGNGYGIPNQLTLNTARRIRMVYHDEATSLLYGFASLFITIDTAGSGSYPLPAVEPSIPLIANTAPRLPAPHVIITDNCMPLGAFIQQMLGDKVILYGDPFCYPVATSSQPANCSVYVPQSGGPALPSKIQMAVQSNESETTATYWNFNGTPHRIAIAYRFLIQLPDGTMNYLTIGFGGNSGPG